MKRSIVKLCSQLDPDRAGAPVDCGETLRRVLANLRAALEESGAATSPEDHARLLLKNRTPPPRR